jgi:hypothetical protein
MKYIFTTLVLLLCITVNAQYNSDTTLLSDIYVPNAFTSDGDNINDVWRPVTEESWDSFMVEVYNVWGECVWYSVDPSEWWMGEGNMENPNFYSINGNYYYVLTYGNDTKILKKMGVLYKLR